MRVVKSFNSNIHRFKAGADIPADADLRPHTVETLKAGGFIAEDRQDPPPVPAGLPVAAAKPADAKGDAPA